jgi:hypothetical protein
VMSITTSEGEIDTADPLTVIFADPVISIPPFEKIVISHLCHLPGS